MISIKIRLEPSLKATFDKTAEWFNSTASGNCAAMFAETLRNKIRFEIRNGKDCTH